MTTNGVGTNGVVASGAAYESRFGIKRTCLKDVDGSDCFDKLIGDKKIAEPSNAGILKRQAVQKLANEYAHGYVKHHAPEDKPFVGAQPLLLREPHMSSPSETARVTAVACRTIEKLIKEASGIHLVCAEDARHSSTLKSLLESATDEVENVDEAPMFVSVSSDWLQTLPFEKVPKRPQTKKRLSIFMGTPGKYLSMCIKSYEGKFDEAYKEDRLIVLCKGVCMLPLGTQEQNIFGVDEDEIVKNILSAVHDKGPVVWGHGKGTKAPIMQKAFGYPIGHDLPTPQSYHGDAGGSANSFDYLVDYVSYLNRVKIAKPSLPVTNWYDTGLLVSVMMGCVVGRGGSLLTDSDGLSMLRDASIGHIISKMNQMALVEPYSTTPGVYNYFIGDGACRLNGGMELAMHLVEDYHAKSLTTLFVFNNHKWAIEDNLVADEEKEHVLHNRDFYDVVQAHDNICICNNELELRETLALLSRRTDAYLKGKAEPSMSIVIIRGLDVSLPPVIGDIEPIRQSSEMKFMRDALGGFADGCHEKIPIYGCSAFEYIQYLHIFVDEMPEGKKYQYVCGRTDIQAAHMCGMQQPEGKCVLFINDVYGINSLGESLRSVLSGFGGKQLLVLIWHPSLLNIIDHFHLHRPPMVWPSVGPHLCSYYVRKQADALFVDFEGGGSAQQVTKQVSDALRSNKPLVVVSMLPEQERDYVSLDIRMKTG